MVICSVRTRPMRSAINPAIQPPSAEASSVVVCRVPACAFERCQPAISDGMMKL